MQGYPRPDLHPCEPRQSWVRAPAPPTCATLQHALSIRSYEVRMGARRVFGARPVDIDWVCASTTFEFQLAEKRTRATALHARSMEMKSAFVSTAAGAILLVSAGCTSVQETQQSGQPSARATMVENANASAQSSTDVSYGGVPDTRTATGGTRSPSSPTCVTRLRCDLFSKH